MVYGCVNSVEVCCAKGDSTSLELVAFLRRWNEDFVTGRGCRTGWSRWYFELVVHSDGVC